VGPPRALVRRGGPLTSGAG